MNRHLKAIEYLSKLQDKTKYCNKRLRLLDAGAGERRIKKYIDENRMIYVSQDFGKYEGGGVPFDVDKIWGRPWDSKNCDIISDITKIPVESNTFDVITCFEVIEHLPNPIECFRELTRILKPGGCLLITAPNLCAEHQQPYIYYTGFSKSFFNLYVPESTGLDIREFYTENDFCQAHFCELMELRRQQRIFVEITARIFLLSVRLWLSLLKRMGGFSQPESCSGYFIVYEK